MSDDDRLRELEHAWEIEYAKLGVAEEVGWGAALFAALAAHAQWHNWLLTIAAFGSTYFFATLRYRRSEKLADEARKPR